MQLGFALAYLVCSIEGHLRWNKHLGDFVPFTDAATYWNVRPLHTFRDLEVHNFNGQLIKFAYYEEKNLIKFEENQTPYKVSGVLGEIWNMLGDYLNFTLYPIKFQNETYGYKAENGEYVGLLGLMQRKEVDVIPRVNFFLGTWNIMDYTFPLWKNSFQIYIRPEIKTNNSWIFKMFSWKVWILVMTFTMIFSMIGCWSERIIPPGIKRSKEQYTLIDHIFFTFAALCSQGWLPKYLEDRCKILELSKRLFSFFILITISSHLVSYMTNTKVERPFTDVLTLLNNTKYNLIVYNGSLAYERFKHISTNFYLDRHQERIMFVDSKKKMYSKVCNNMNKKKYAILESDDRQKASGCNICILVQTGDPIFQTWITSGIIKGFEFKRSFDLGILKLHEVGLIDSLKDRWMVPEYVAWDTSIVESIALSHVYMLFVILLLGIFFSTIMCIVENIFYIYQRNNSKRRRHDHRNKNKTLCSRHHHRHDDIAKRQSLRLIYKKSQKFSQHFSSEKWHP